MQIWRIISGFYSNKLKMKMSLINDLLIYKYLSVNPGKLELISVHILSCFLVEFVVIFL
jgi:hypothetical protein